MNSKRHIGTSVACWNCISGDWGQGFRGKERAGFKDRKGGWGVGLGDRTWVRPKKQSDGRLGLSCILSVSWAWRGVIARGKCGVCAISDACVSATAARLAELRLPASQLEPVPFLATRRPPDWNWLPCHRCRPPLWLKRLGCSAPPKGTPSKINSGTSAGLNLLAGQQRFSSPIHSHTNQLWTPTKCYLKIVCSV